MENNKDNRVIYFDILNILAIIAVVALHCNGIIHNSSLKLSRAWTTSLIVECVFYWAVPIFLMLSGATLMKYREKYDTKAFFKKRFTKIFIPFLFWATIMLIWKCATKQLKIDNFSIQNILEIFFSNKEESTYYFMFLILGVYITIPVLSKLSDKCNRKLCWYTVITIFITQSTLPVIFKLFNITYNNSLSIQIGGYMIFILLGYLLSTEDLTKKQIIIIYIMGALSIIFRYSMTYYLTNVTGKLDKTLFDYTQFHSVLLACAVFIFIKNIDFDKIIKSNKIRNVLAKTASCSFGIYLIHLIVKYYEILIFNIDIKSWQWRTLGIVTTYLLSLGIVYMLKHIPIINKIVP